MRVTAHGVAAIRALTLVFFAATAFYGILAFSPFAYNQFIRPNLIPWLGWSVTFYGGLFLGVLSVTLLTLLADVERPATRALALGYIAVWGVVALGLFIRPVLGSLGANGWRRSQRDHRSQPRSPAVHGQCWSSDRGDVRHAWTRRRRLLQRRRISERRRLAARP